MTDEEVAQALEAMVVRIKVIKENEIFKAFLQRNNVSENDDGAGSKGRELRKKHRRGRLGKDGDDDGLSPTDGSKKKRGAARQRLQRSSRSNKGVR